MDYLDYLFIFNEDHETGTLIGYTLNERKAHIPRAVAGYDIIAIGRRAFTDTRTLIQDKEPLEEIEFDEGYREIHHEAFGGCGTLRRLMLPSTIETIYGDPFVGADNLEEIVFPRGNSHFVFEGGKLMSADRTKVYFERKN